MELLDFYADSFCSLSATFGEVLGHLNSGNLTKVEWEGVGVALGRLDVLCADMGLRSPLAHIRMLTRMLSEGFDDAPRITAIVSEVQALRCRRVRCRRDWSMSYKIT
jgi:hypothetical protein